jgi:hypothetical protein
LGVAARAGTFAGGFGVSVGTRGKVDCGRRPADRACPIVTGGGVLSGVGGKTGGGRLMRKVP